MDSIGSIAAGSTYQAQAKVADAVSIRVLKMAQDQQKSVATLIEGAAESAEEIQQQQPCQGCVDVTA